MRLSSKGALIGRPQKWLNPTQVQGVILPEYNQWSGILERCRGKYSLRCPTYAGCTLHPDWLNYDCYVSWAREQIGFLSRDEKGRLFQLDKDILSVGNKSYDPNACVFVPQALNKFLTLRGRARGNCVLGVTLHRKLTETMYSASLNVGKGQGKKVFLGLFETEQLAHEAYLTAKKEIAMQLATKYEGLVDPRVIQRLRNFNLTLGATQ